MRRCGLLPATSPRLLLPSTPHRLALVALSSLLPAKTKEGVGGARCSECCQSRRRRKARLAPAQLLLLLLGAHRHGDAAIGAPRAAGKPVGRPGAVAGARSRELGGEEASHPLRRQG